MNRNLIRYIILPVIATAMLILIAAYGYFLHWRSNSDISLPGNSKVASLSTGELEYRLDGDGKSTILMVHGTPGTHTHLDVSVLMEAGYRVLVVARPGYMNSSLNTGKTPQEQADVYKELLDYLNIDEVTVLGISGGGPSSLQFALRHPNRTSALVMYGAVSQAIEFAAPQLADRVTNTEFGLWIAFNWIKRRSNDSDNRKIASFYLQTLFPVESVWQGLENDLSNMVALPDYDLTELNLPVLVLHGTEDRIVLFSHGHFVASTAPRATLKRLEGANHEGLITDFNENMAMMISWLNDL